MCKVTSFRAINIDYEWWSGEITPNWENVAKFFEDLRNNLDNNNLENVEVTWAAPAGVDVINQIPNDILCRIAKVVSPRGGIQIMTYDFNGAFSPNTNYLAPLKVDPRDPLSTDPVYGQYSIEGAVNAYQNKTCIPNSQISIGAPAYGRSMYSNSVSPWNPVTGTPEGQFDNSGVFYHDCIEHDICHGGNSLPPGVTLVSTQNNPYGNVTREPWGSGQAFDQSFVITYDDTSAVCAKADFVRENNLGGAMLYDLSQQGSQNELVLEMQACLNNNATATNTHSMSERSISTETVTSSTNNISTLIDSMSEYFPKEMTTVLKDAAINGFLYSILSELTEPVLTKILKQHDYDETQIYYANQAIKSLIIFAQGAWIGSAASFGTSTFLEYIGCSKQTASTAGSVAAVVTTLTTSSATLATTAAALAGGYVGAKTAQYAAKFGLLAVSRVRDTFTVDTNDICKNMNSSRKILDV